jgi:hypothetical protein
MFNFILGFVLGVVSATVGFSNLAQYVDQGVQAIQQTVQEIQK